MRKDRENKSGSVVVEFAVIITFLLIPLFMGMWDTYQVIDMSQVLTRAAREGVVMASRGDDPIATVHEYVQAAGLDSQNLTVTVQLGADDPNFGQEVSVTLSYNIGDTTVYPWGDIIPEGLNAVAVAKME